MIPINFRFVIKTTCRNIQTKKQTTDGLQIMDIWICASKQPTYKRKNYIYAYSPEVVANVLFVHVVMSTVAL